MSKRPKIHVFLGAPPPSSVPPSLPEAGMEEEGRPPDGWEHLELTWTRGGLRPETQDQPEDPVTGAPGADGEADRPHRDQDSQDQDPAGAEGPGQEDDRCPASVRHYLDSCFPAAGDPEPEPGPPLSTRTLYLSTWTQSQALMLKARSGVQPAFGPEGAPPGPPRSPPPGSSSTPELFSPETPSPGGSAELFSPPSPTPRAQGGVVLQATAEGILCSQEAGAPRGQGTPTTRGPPQDPPWGQSTPQDLSKGQGRPQDQSTTQGAPQDLPRAPPQDPSSGQDPPRGQGTPQDPPRDQDPPQDPPRGHTRLLSCCGPVGARCSVLVVVVHPCHLKEVQVKAGRAAGTWVPLASIVVTDQSEVELKVVLWRRAAFWVLTVTPGDLLQISGLQVAEDKWRGETVLQSTFCSKLLHLGHASTSAAGPGPLGALSAFVRGRRPLLASVPPRPPQDPRRLPYACLRTLRGNMLVHALLRVTHAHLSPEAGGVRGQRSPWSPTEAGGVRGQRSGVRRAVLTVEQLDQTGTLLLWGGAVDWTPQFQQHRDAVWDFRFLLVGAGSTSDPPQLHSTPWSSARPLDPDHPRARDHIRAEQRLRTWTRTRTGPPELDLDTLLSQKYSGEVQLRVQVLSFRFQTGSQPVLDGFSSLDGVLAVLGGAVSFTGCSRCGAELHADANGVYRTCRRCPPHPAARRLYRPAVVTVGGGGFSRLNLHVPPDVVQRILGAPPHLLEQSSGPGSLLQAAAGRLWALLAPPRRTVSLSVRSHFLCDENSVPLAQDFTLLELKFPPELELKFPPHPGPGRQNPEAPKS